MKCSVSFMTKATSFPFHILSTLSCPHPSSSPNLFFLSISPLLTHSLPLLLSRLAYWGCTAAPDGIWDSPLFLLSFLSAYFVCVCVWTIKLATREWHLLQMNCSSDTCRCLMNWGYVLTQRLSPLVCMWVKWHFILYLYVCTSVL